METSAKYNDIGIGYNVTRQADPYITERLLKLLAPSTGSLYLDIGCGTGNYTIKLAQTGLNFYGVEPSDIMLAEAKVRSDKVKWLSGKAENIPVDDENFNGAIATLTIHHWTNHELSFTELWRVLKPCSKLIIFTATPDQMQGYWLNHYFPKMLNRSILQMPTLQQISNAAKQAGFELVSTENYHIQDDLKDLFLYSGKHKPELYFDENVRRSISSFASLANKQEVAKGLKQLRADIDTGKFENNRQRYDNRLGDYIFIVFEKH